MNSTVPTDEGLKQRLFSFTEWIIEEALKQPIDEDFYRDDAKSTKTQRNKSEIEFILHKMMYNSDFWNREIAKNCLNYMAENDELMIHQMPNEILGIKTTKEEKIPVYQNEFLLPFVMYYLDLFGTSVSEKKFETAFEAFEQYFPEFPEEIDRYVMLLEGLNIVGTNKIKTDEFVIRKLNAEEKHILIKMGQRGYGSGYQSDEFFKSLWTIQLNTAKQPDVFIGDSDWGVILDDYVSPEEIEENMLLFLRLFTGFPVSSTALLEYGVMGKGSQRFAMRGRKHVRKEEIFTIRKKDENRLREAWEKFKENEAKIKGTLRISLDRYMKSFNGIGEDMLIDLIIALEALYKPTKIKWKGKQISNSYIVQFPEDPYRMENAKLLQKAYGIRNNILHGTDYDPYRIEYNGQVKTLWQMTSEVREILRKALAKKALGIRLDFKKNQE